MGWWWSKKQSESDDLRETKRHLAMVYGQSRAVLTLTAAVLENMSPFQRSSISMVLKKYIAEGISMRDLPKGMAAPEDAQKYRDIYSSTLQSVVSVPDKPRVQDKELESAVEELQKIINALTPDPPSQ